MGMSMRVTWATILIALLFAEQQVQQVLKFISQRVASNNLSNTEKPATLHGAARPTNHALEKLDQRDLLRSGRRGKQHTTQTQSRNAPIAQPRQSLYQAKRQLRWKCDPAIRTEDRKPATTSPMRKSRLRCAEQ